MQLAVGIQMGARFVVLHILDAVGSKARLWEVYTPNALEVLMTVMQRVSGWSCDMLLQAKQYYVSFFCSARHPSTKTGHHVIHSSLYGHRLPSKLPRGRSTASISARTTTTGPPVAMRFAKQQELRRVTLRGSV